MILLDRELKKYKELLFVDGYNIINSWDQLKVSSDDQLEEARRKLIDILMEYKAYSKEGIILVFDSYNVKTDRQVQIQNKLIIVYTKELETADHFIERSAEKYARHKKIRVATSDRLEQDIILGKGASRISAKELEYEINNFYKDISKISEKKKRQNRLHLSGLNPDSIQLLEKIKADFKKTNK
ncbi:MAG: NYN domain-containing protein [Bacillota bacterium]|nr:NYN domain-containing protein [Bacillota bacterium]